MPGPLNRYRTPLLAIIAGVGLSVAFSQNSGRTWLAGDSHIHSHWSPGYDRTKTPPEPLKGEDARYSTPLNAQKAREHGLSWMVTTDHGGPNHSKLNLVHAYAELSESRQLVPEVLQFYGMEMNMPAMDHHTLIIPNTDDEWRILFNIESQFDKSEAWPVDPARDTEEAARKVLLYINSLRRLPLVFANHPSRSALGIGQYGLDEPREFRDLNDSAPEVYRGMEGAPGHQAKALAPDGSLKKDAGGQPTGHRGSYDNTDAPTLGGFDQMTAIRGGLWDSMLGEGRRFWIVATSDSHVHYTDTTDPGSDFWPGEFQKTYVSARKTYDDILDGLRAGRIFVTAGDLITELDVRATAAAGTAIAGGTVTASKGEDVQVEIGFRVPAAPNARGNRPKVQRVDLIVGEVRRPLAGRNHDRNETTKVVARFTAEDWHCRDSYCSISTTLRKMDRNLYFRVRGTNTTEAEPQPDPKGEDPWSDLWFYSNPIFVELN